MSCHIIRIVQYFSTKDYFVLSLMQTRKQVRLWRKLEGSAETLGGAAETVEKM